MNFGTEAGWLGLFTRDQAPGAIANGARIYKAAEEPGDGTPLGTHGTVLGSLAAEHLEQRSPDGTLIRIAYFVEWDNRPRAAVGVSDFKIKEVTT